VATLVKFLKSINREDRKVTTDPREIAQLRAEGYREEQPKKRQEQSSNSSQQSDKKTK